MKIKNIGIIISLAAIPLISISCSQNNKNLKEYKFDFETFSINSINRLSLENTFSALSPNKKIRIVIKNFNSSKDTFRKVVKSSEAFSLIEKLFNSTYRGL